MSKPHTKQVKRRQGFSLIEVLIALALFAICSNLIASAFINALLARERDPSSTYQDIAINTVRRQLLLEKNIDDAEEGGTLTLLEKGEASWTTEIYPTDIIDLFECRFDIEFFESDNPNQDTYSETLYLLRPTWSESDERSSLLQEKKDALLDQRSFESF
jgi:prepilin-type N-terminal cleavage/methylation domain-containing protein